MFKVIGFNGKDVWVQNSETSELLRVYRKELRRLLDRNIEIEGAKKYGRGVTLAVPDKPNTVKAKILLRDNNLVKDGVLTGILFWKSLADRENKVRISNYCGVVPPEVMQAALADTEVVLIVDDNVYIDGHSLALKMVSSYVDMHDISDININRIYLEMFKDTINMADKIVNHLIDNEERKILFKGLTWLCWLSCNGEEYKDYLGSNSIAKTLICNAIDELYLAKEYKFEKIQKCLYLLESCDFVDNDVIHYLSPINTIIRILKYFQCPNFSNDILIRYKSKIYSLIN